MSLYNVPRPWSSGYAIPGYVQAEPPERGTFVTAQLPRGTISEVIPNYLAVPQPRGTPSDALSGFDLSNPLVVVAAGVGAVYVLSRLLKKRRGR